MITQEQIEGLKCGDKLIFFLDGELVSAKKGNVFTFSHWFNKESVGWFFCCTELYGQENDEHCFDIYQTELFDENIHKEFRIMNKEIVDKERQDFINKHIS